MKKERLIYLDIIRIFACLCVLTYPLFLVHHKIIYLMARGFDLANFPYRSTIMLFICYMIITAYLSKYIMYLAKIFTLITNKERVKEMK